MISLGIPIVTILVFVLVGSSHPSQPTHSTVLFFALVILFLYGYFVPTIIAYSRGAYHRLGIFIINLGLGYTGIGYLFALLWAIYDDKGRYRG
jgi:hypothetical protein